VALGRTTGRSIDLIGADVSVFPRLPGSAPTRKHCAYRARYTGR
jgi:hypothetical protein